MFLWLFEAFIGGTEMHFASSGSFTIAVFKSNCLVKEYCVYRIYIENILCLCQCGAGHKDFCYFLCLCIHLFYHKVQFPPSLSSFMY